MNFSTIKESEIRETNSNREKNSNKEPKVTKNNLNKETNSSVEPEIIKNNSNKESREVEIKKENLGDVFNLCNESYNNLSNTIRRDL